MDVKEYIAAAAKVNNLMQVALEDEGFMARPGGALAVHGMSEQVNTLLNGAELRAEYKDECFDEQRDCFMEQLTALESERDQLKGENEALRSALEGLVTNLGTLGIEADKVRDAVRAYCEERGDVYQMHPAYDAARQHSRAMADMFEWYQGKND